MHMASSRFESTLYDPKKGVKAYVAELTRWACRMPQAPNNYSFRKRFLDGLLTNIISKMIEKGATPHIAKLKVMIKTVE